ncbi:MAG: hypothetical protein IJO70_07025 [Lachnospiraceae bacterium]|nr:hypothetical protein [Lachnospiraceae bacterium]
MGTRAELSSLHYNLAVEKSALQSLTTKADRMKAAYDSLSTNVDDFWEIVSNTRDSFDSYNEDTNVWRGKYYDDAEEVCSMCEAYWAALCEMMDDVWYRYEYFNDLKDSKQGDVDYLEYKIQNFVIDEEVEECL